MRNIALTGMPRSGTTLVCNLLNQVDNVIALHEPIIAYHFLKGLNRNESIEKVIQFFNSSRASLLDSRMAVTKHRNGIIPDNSITDEYLNTDFKSNSRIDKMEHGEIHFDKQLSESFDLFIKDPTLFTVLLPELINSIPTYAIIRNPLSVFLSWNSVPFKISNGRIPPAEMFDKNLSDKLNNESNLLDRQGIILQWYFNNYLEHLNENSIIKYEEIISTQGRVLSKLGVNATELNIDLLDRNTNILYSRQIVEDVLGVIKKYYLSDFEALYSLDYLVETKNKIMST